MHGLECVFAHHWSIKTLKMSSIKTHYHTPLFKMCSLFCLKRKSFITVTMVRLHLSRCHPGTDAGIILWLSPTLFPASFTIQGCDLSWQMMLTKNAVNPLPSRSPSTLRSPLLPVFAEMYPRYEVNISKQQSPQCWEVV